MGIREDLLRPIKEGAKRFVITAPTGSGKSTLVPAELSKKGRVIVVVPRRVAAVELARYVAKQRGGRVGDEVGYQIRFDNKARQTNLTYVTEGVFLNMLKSNPNLKGIDAVILDEVHERNILTDVSLALLKRINRDDLIIGAMSATMDADRFGEYLGAKVYRAGGKLEVDDENDVIRNGRHVVKINYRPESKINEVIREIRQIPEQSEKPILVFEPGKREIAKTIDEIKSEFPDSVVLPFHAELPSDAIDNALSRSKAGEPVIIVSTNIAEASVTIPDVNVIDRGYARFYQWDPETKIGGLVTVLASQFSAQQRSGRSGRTSNGLAYRLWSKESHKRRPLSIVPEIKRSNLTNVVLMLRSFGVKDIENLDWLDNPGPERIRAAEQELKMTGALDKDGNITDIGREMASWPLDAKTARMFIEGINLGGVGLDTIATIAALQSTQRIMLSPKNVRDKANKAQERFREFGKKYRSDWFSLLVAYQEAKKNRFDEQWCKEHFLRRNALVEADKIKRQLLSILKNKLGVTTIKPDDLSNEENATKITTAVRRAITAGYLSNYWNIGKLNRSTRLSHGTSVLFADHMIAMPRKIHEGLTVLDNVTEIDPEWILQYAPDNKLEEYMGGYVYDEDKRRVVREKVVKFEGSEIARKTEDATGQDAISKLARILNDVSLPEDDPLYEIVKRNRGFVYELRDLKNRDPEAGNPYDDNGLIDFYTSILKEPSLNNIAPQDVEVTDEKMSSIIGKDWNEYRSRINRLYPKVVTINGVECKVSYSKNVYGDKMVYIDIGEDLAQTVTDDDLPEFEGFGRKLRFRGENFDTTNELRVTAAIYDRGSIAVDYPHEALEMYKKLDVLTVEHPDGTSEIAGYWGMSGQYSLNVYRTKDAALETTRLVLRERISEVVRQTIRQTDEYHKLRSEYGIMSEYLVPDDWLSQTLMEYGLDAILDNYDGFIDDISAKVQESCRELIDCIENIDGLNRKLSDLYSGLNKYNRYNTFRDISVKISDASNDRNTLQERLEAFRDAKKQIAEWDSLLGNVTQRIGNIKDELQKVLQDVPDVVKQNVDTIVQQIDAIIDNDEDIPNLDDAEGLLENLRAGIENIVPRIEEIEEMASPYLSKCPICGEKMDSWQCPSDHDYSDDLRKMDLPDGYVSRVVLYEITTSEGELYAEAIFDYGTVSIKRYLPTTKFDGLYYKPVALLTDDEIELKERIDDIKRDISDIERRIEQLEDDLSISQPKRIDELDGYSVFPDVQFTQEMYKGRKQWYAIVHIGNAEVKLIIDRYAKKTPKRGKRYVAIKRRVLSSSNNRALVTVDIKSLDDLRAKLEEKKSELIDLENQRASINRDAIRIDNKQPDNTDDDDFYKKLNDLASAWGCEL